MMPATDTKTEFPTIDRESVPAPVEYDVAKTIFDSIRRHFEQPGVQERYEKWKEREKTQTQEV